MKLSELSVGTTLEVDDVLYRVQTIHPDDGFLYATEVGNYSNGRAFESEEITADTVQSE